MVGGEKTNDLEFTPTWIVAAVCSVIIMLSLVLERALHYLGKSMKKRSQRSLYEAVLKVKEELMLLGFISFMLSAFQGTISRICIRRSYLDHMLPCRRRKDYDPPNEETNHLQIMGAVMRHLLEEAKSENHCEKKGKVELLSIGAIHQLHIFIFALAITHVVLSVLTICLGGLKIRLWKVWEDSIAKNNYNTETSNLESKVTHVQHHDFIKEHSLALKCDSSILSWLHSFLKQFHSSVTKSDYITLRWGFIMMHCRGNPRFNFHRCMVRAYEADFKKVVGISWYLWAFAIVFLLMNVEGWHTFFWITLIPLVLLLAVGTKLEHVITQLAKEVAEKHTAIEGDLVVQPSDDHFWFHKPRFVLHLIHFILFQNAFEIAYFFWLWVTYGFHSCIMGKVTYVIPRLIFGVVIQVLCSFSTLPLYAIVTQMGSSFKKTIFDEHVQENLAGWAQKARRRKAVGPMTNQASPSRVCNTHAGDRSPDDIQLQEVPLVHSVSTNTRLT